MLQIKVMITITATVDVDETGVKRIGNVGLGMDEYPFPYANPDGSPNRYGNMITSSVLCAGLSNNIHGSEQHNNISSADHLRFVIENLENMFATPITIEKR